MDFRFTCFVVHHVSERVTVTPLELPRFAVHAASLERATEDLTLAIDDRVARAHPRRISEFARPGGGTLLDVDVPALRVWGSGATETRAVRITTVVAPAHRPFVEVRAPRLDVRVWLRADEDVAARAAATLAAHLAGREDAEVLAVRREGVEALAELTVRATPTRLSALRRADLHRDERPPPRPRDADDDDAPAGGSRGEGDADDAGDDDDDGDDDGYGGKRRSRPPAAPGKARKVPTPTLDKIGVALHKLARAGAVERAYERDELVARVLARMEAKRAEPLVLVGNAGVGKSAVLHELAARMAAQDAPEARRARKFFYVDGARMIAGQGFFGEWQQQTLDAFEEARRAGAFVNVGHVVELLDAGKSAHFDHNTAQVLGPVLAQREVAVVGEATPEEWARLERRNQGFAALWSVLRVDEPAPEVTAKIVKRVAAELGAERDVAVDPGAVDAAVALARRFRPYGSLLGNSVTFARRLVESAAHARRQRVTGVDAIELFSAESGIPPVLLRDDLPLDPARVRGYLASRVMGQRAAVDRAAEVVTLVKAAMADARRPLAVLFFAGPTGVGKTELSKALAEFVFGSRDRLVRLDMGEYAGPDALARLIGDYDTPGHLPAAVRRQAFCVVLLDEIEKAHPAVFDALLGVLGEGRLTDADGRFTDFRNAVIVMTSNLGADTLRARVGFGSTEPGALAREARRHYLGEAERFFRPELFNRIDDFVVFDALDRDAIRAIVRREVGLVARREGLRTHDVALAVSDAALDWLAARGFDPRYGARPLKRAVERELVNPLAAYLASHPNAGAARIAVVVDGDALALHPTTLASGDDGAARVVAQGVLALAAEVRAEVRRWAASRVAAALREQVSYFDRASKLPGFWKESQLANESAHRVAVARELLEAFASLARHAEATEDLAFEAYYERDAGAAEALRAELAAQRAELPPLAERLYATTFPPRAGAVLYVVPGRGAQDHAYWLARSYLAWAKGRELAVAHYVAVAPSTQEKPAGPLDDPSAGWAWLRNEPDAPVAGPWGAHAVVVAKSAAATLLAGEHGAHRFHDGTGTSLVKVRFEPRAASGAESLTPVAKVAKEMPEAEIRRVAIHKSSLKDLRTELEQAVAAHQVDLEPVLAAWLRYRVLGKGAEPWT